LNDKDFVAANRFRNKGGHFAVAELLVVHIAQMLTVGMCNFVCQVNGCSSGKYLYRHELKDKNSPDLYGPGLPKLSDQGSNLDFPESKSGVLPVTPSDNGGHEKAKMPQNAPFWDCKGRIIFLLIKRGETFLKIIAFLG
jgi:hypothetical protein